MDKTYQRHRSPNKGALAGLGLVGLVVAWGYSSCRSGDRLGSQPGADPGGGSAITSLMEPHALPDVGPWFEGWYARFEPKSATEPSLGVIVGSNLPPGARGASALKNGMPGFASVLISQGPKAPLRVLNASLERTFLLDSEGKPVVRDPLPSRIANFSWKGEGAGTLTPTSIKLAQQGQWSIWASIAPPRGMSWISLLGPAGPATLARFLPIQWFIYGQDLPASWELRLTGREGDTRYASGVGGGKVHFEKNWGKRFPSHYFWLQGSRRDSSDSIVAAGGSVVSLGEGAPRVESQLVIVTKGSRRFVFSPVNGALVPWAEVRACEGGLTLKSRSVDGAELTLTASAPSVSFGNILIPTGTAFEPRSEQSFAAALRAEVRTPGGELVVVSVPQGALEFGGSHKCTKRSKP